MIAGKLCYSLELNFYVCHEDKKKGKEEKDGNIYIYIVLEGFSSFSDSEYKFHL